MLDIKLFRENPKLIKESLKKRKDSEKLKLVNEIIKLDQDWRDKKLKLDELRKKRNEVSHNIAKFKKEGKDVKKFLEEASKIPTKLEKLEKDVEYIKNKLNENLMRMPNILHESVPYGKDDTENKEIRKWGKPYKFDFELKSHVEILENLGLVDFERSAKISGSGFYILLGDLALLEQAVTRFAINTMLKKNFVLLQPPLMMRRQPYEGVTDLEDFENVMYKIDNDDEYLIATSEHPMAAMYMNETIDESQLPLKFVGSSMCFRKEIGAHGIDTKGLFRLHQFNKVEQFVFCKPEESWKLHEEMIKNAEEVFQALEIPYRIVNICTGDIGTVAAKKYDLEGWSPRQKKYTELCSCSNVTDYQARRLNIKYGKEGGEKQILHTLNSTVVATSRVLVAIIENYQNKDGTVTIPKVLLPYMDKKKLLKKL